MVRHRPHLLLEIPEGSPTLPLPEAVRHHLDRVLRFERGGLVDYTDGAGLAGEGVYAGDAVVRGDERIVPPPLPLTVAVSPPADKARARFLVEKLAEIGVARLVWLKTRHGEGRPPNSAKVEAWVRSALEQSRGVWLMEVEGLMAIADVPGLGIPVFADPGGGLVTDLPADSNLVLCIGPEGGFAADEIPENAIRIGLGDRVLRVETAAIVGATLLRHRG